MCPRVFRFYLLGSCLVKSVVEFQTRGSRRRKLRIRVESLNVRGFDLANKHARGSRRQKLRIRVKSLNVRGFELANKLDRFHGHYVAKFYGS